MELFGNLETVTYKTGRRKILKVMSGTELADRLLQMAMDPDIKTVATGKAVGTPSQKHSHTAGKAMFKLGKNQLRREDICLGQIFRSEHLTVPGYGAAVPLNCTGQLKTRPWEIVFTIRM